MSDINKTNTTLFNRDETLAAYLSGKGSPDGRQYLGPEIETWCVQRPATENDALIMMTPQESQRILQSIASQDPNATRFYEEKGMRLSAPLNNDTPLVYVASGKINYQLELCGVIEAALDPFPLEDVSVLLDLIDQAETTLETETRKIGLQTYPYAVPASVEITQCENNMVNRERLVSEWRKFSSFGSDNPGLRTMGLSTSTQINLSYRNAQDAYEIITLGNLLSPVIYALFSNTTGFVEGKGSCDIPRADFWLQHNKFAPRGGIPEKILDAMFLPDNPEQIIRNWIEYVRSVPMVYYYDENGTARFDISPTFNDLEKQGLGTKANYALAESLVWPDVKLIGGQRIELRGADTGPWQPTGLAVFAASIFGTPETRQECLRMVFNASSIDRNGLLKSREEVATLGMNAPFGQIKVKDLLPLLLPFVTGYTDTLESKNTKWKKLVEVMQTGISDQMVTKNRGFKNAKAADFKLTR